MQLRGRRYYYQSRRVPDAAMRIIALPIAEMTLQEIGDVIGMQPSTVSDYLKILRREGLISTFHKRKNCSAEGRALIRQRRNAETKAALDAVNAVNADTRETICKATWAVYAAVLTEEQMTAHFKLKRSKTKEKVA